MLSPEPGPTAGKGDAQPTSSQIDDSIAELNEHEVTVKQDSNSATAGGGSPVWSIDSCGAWERIGASDEELQDRIQFPRDESRNPRDGLFATLGKFKNG